MENACPFPPHVSPDLHVRACIPQQLLDAPSSFSSPSMTAAGRRASKRGHHTLDTTSRSLNERSFNNGLRL